MKDDRAFTSRSVRLGGLVEFSVYLGLSGSWIGLLGGLWWFFDLFAHFRPQYIACCVVAVVWFAWRKSRIGLAVGTASLLLNLVLVFGWFSKSRNDEVAPDSHLRAISINVLTSNHSLEKVLEYVRRSDADVVFLMEVDSWWAKALTPLKLMYPRYLIESREDNFGVAIFSSLAVDQLFTDALDDSGVPTVFAILRHGDRKFRFMGAHPVPPTGPKYSQWRNDELTALADEAVKSAEPVLLMGDLNTTPWSAGMRILTRNGKLQLPAPAFQWRPTWRSRSLLAVSIDHALASSPLTVLRRDTGPDVGSDHQPIIIEVGWLR